MRLVRLKPQGPGPDRGPDCPVQQKIYKVGPLWAPKFLEKICGLLKFLPQGGPGPGGARSRFHASGPGGTMIRP